HLGISRLFLLSAVAGATLRPAEARSRSQPLPSGMATARPLRAAAAGGILYAMSEVTRLLDAASQGDARAGHGLVPLVYDQPRRLAQFRLAQEAAGQTLQATALVHEAYLRLVGQTDEPRWHGGRHFFAAAAEAMRRILIDRARARGADKRGGGRARQSLDEVDP